MAPLSIHFSIAGHIDYFFPCFFQVVSILVLGKPAVKIFYKRSIFALDFQRFKKFLFVPSFPLLTRNFETNMFRFGTASSIVVRSLVTWSALFSYLQYTSAHDDRTVFLVYMWYKVIGNLD